ncbi:glycerate kinase [Vagococcus intermedius]|uniref:Glycerate kinase n=1 Tax=Vagococcus intermedius TaxID=2991418 RepID=A0AAF0CT60_9ENTE|nr:glycerate kinase [Vagococcus intermedius]WEG72401.1 glycerate kinase [Vagococcus intermedius]WEG74489.1 glycerate kinase [Vagococcus intermedius]
MKKFVLAPDSFKESLTAKEVCQAMESGLRQAFPDSDYLHIPMADGGEGTMQSLVDATEGVVKELEVVGPLGETVIANYGVLGDGITGVIEMASASGIQLVPKEARNPLLTTTYGTGQLIKACLDEGVKQIIIGIGGSATNDAGAGMAMALGASLLDEKGCSIGLGGGELGNVTNINIDQLDRRLHEVDLLVACDVTNPLCGEIGASYVFGPQKGASQEMVALLDANLAHFANVIEKQLSIKVLEEPGSGAAGGLGAGLLAFTNAKLEKGIEIVTRYTELEKHVKEADYVFTGEGGMDSQTKYGKTPYGVAKIAQRHHKTVIGIAGHIGDGIEELYDEGFTAILGIVPSAVSLDKALETGFRNVERTCENIGRLLINSNRK